ncbi:MAG: hypothetical protein HFH91_00285 [Lachnospiraceae bacterium]|nr:hypothetical protein [Lachnospiraceae bacterium]
MEALKSSNQEYLKIMEDIYHVSERSGLRSFIWGGFVADILQGEFTREHGDLDCFTENLAENRELLQRQYEELGYSVSYMEEFWMLRIEKNGKHASFNSVRNIDGIAHWYHIGPHGTVYFPYDWLDRTPRRFYGIPVYTIGEKMAYTLKTSARLLNPKWETREKDHLDIAILERLLDGKAEEREEIKKKVWSHNPYWYARGYEEYYFPVLSGSSAASCN